MKKMILITNGIDSEGMNTIIIDTKNNQTYQIDFGKKPSQLIDKIKIFMPETIINFLTHHHTDHNKYLPKKYIYGETCPYKQKELYSFWEIPHDIKTKTYCYQIKPINTFYLTDCMEIPTNIKTFVKTHENSIKIAFIEMNHDFFLPKLKHEQNAKQHLNHMEAITFIHLIYLHNPNALIFLTHISKENMPKETLWEIKKILPNAIILDTPKIILINQEENKIKKIINIK